MQQVVYVAAQLAQLHRAGQRAGDRAVPRDAHRQEAGRLQRLVLHGRQHVRLGQHHAAAPQLPPQGRLQLFRRDGPVGPQYHVPGGQVQHPRRFDGATEVRSAALLQGKQVQQHLYAQAVPHVRQVEGLFPRLVVHHPQVQPAVLQPAVHPVHLSRHGQGGIPLGDGDGGQLAIPAAEAKLEGHRPEV